MKKNQSREQREESRALFTGWQDQKKNSSFRFIPLISPLCSHFTGGKI